MKIEPMIDTERGLSGKERIDRKCVLKKLAPCDHQQNLLFKNNIAPNLIAMSSSDTPDNKNLNDIEAGFLIQIFQCFIHHLWLDSKTSGSEDAFDKSLRFWLKQNIHLRKCTRNVDKPLAQLR